MGQQDLKLADFRPRGALVTRTIQVLSPRFPVVDAHNHLGQEFGGGWIDRPLPEVIDMMDQAGVCLLIDLDGGWGEHILEEHLTRLEPAPDRFRVFGGIDWSQWAERGNRFPEWAASRLHVQKQRGAAGVKIWKPFGLSVRDQNGERVAVDDMRLAPIWETAGELGLPVMMHVADPAAFFEPLDERNERWEELQAHPDWHFPSPPYPVFTQIMAEFAHLVASFPATAFIGAHVGCCAENLGFVGKMLDRCPNYMIDISARIGELGRQPYSARRFFFQYADRILFGLDMGLCLDGYRKSYRFLETDDEYFNYSPGDVPLQGRWHIYGLALPEDVLKKVYQQNAMRLLGLDILP